MLSALAIYVLIALLVAGFVAVPIQRIGTKPLKAKLVLATAAVLFVWGIGGGAYLMLGQPWLAARDYVPVEQRDLNGVISAMAEKMRKDPEPRGLLLLGDAYLTLGDADNAVKTLTVGINASKGKPSIALLLKYAEAVIAKDGKLNSEAERALKTVLAADADNKDARALLASGDAAANPPDINAMVESLATRLKDNPKDAEGWQRLVRAYVVLGDKAKLEAALKDARVALASDPVGLAAVEAEDARPK